MSQRKSKSSKSKSKSKKTTAPAAISKKVNLIAQLARVSAAKKLSAPAPKSEPLMKTQLKPAPVEVQAPARLVSRAEFMDLVRKEAYRRYTARRSFKQGSPFQDWVNAEAAVSGKLAAEGARLS